MAHALIYSTEYLREKTEKRFPWLAGKGFVAPNLLHPAHYQEPLWGRRSSRKKPLLLWMGCPHHDKDLEILIPVVEALHEGWQDVFDLRFFGSCHPEIRARWVGGWAREYEGCDFTSYPELLQDIAPDVMLCPLADDPFSLGRSDLKLKEAMAKGAMCLYSPVGPFAGFDYGVRCLTADDWMKGLVSVAQMYYEQRELFWNHCRLNYEVAKKEFFWGADNAGNRQWDAVLEAVLGGSNV
jgi:hypothetical protein